MRGVSNQALSLGLLSFRSPSKGQPFGTVWVVLDSKTKELFRVYCVAIETQDSTLGGRLKQGVSAKMGLRFAAN